MRILLVSHLYPPRHTAGTEVYTSELARRLLGRGYEVQVFTSEKDIGRRDLSLSERVEAGVRVHELISNLYLDDFEESWNRPAVDALFGDLLERVQPDLIHIHHLMYLSSGLLSEAKRRGIAVVFTLHDFWLGCPRFGQLVHADGGLCERVDPQRCASCLPSFDWRQSALKQRVGRAISGVHKVSGVDLGPLARRLERWLASESSPASAGSQPSEAETNAWADRIRSRAEGLRAHALECVDFFVAPSCFLRDWFVEWGIPPQRIVQLSTGVDASAFETAKRTSSRDAEQLLQVAFLGTLVPIKGAHILVDAWGRLPASLRARAKLVLHGPLTHTPAYVQELERRCAPLGIELSGAVERERVPAVMRASDLIVVPSVWYENRPLVVLEALASETPLLVSEPGGMSELVEEGVSGWRFPMGDAAALAERLEELISHPERLDELYREQLQLPSWEALTDAQVELYERVLADRKQQT